MAYDNESEFKYIDGLDEIPITGPDPFDKEDKLEAAEKGEAKLESDVNEGSPIPDQVREAIHGEAAACWATYRLVLGIKSPESQSRGDSLDEGTERMAFADRIKQMYDSHVDSIIMADADASEGGENTVGFEVADW